MSDNEIDQIAREVGGVFRQAMNVARSYIHRRREQGRHAGVPRLTGAERRELAEQIRTQVGEQRVTQAWFTKRVEDYRRETIAERRRMARTPGLDPSAGNARLEAMRFGIESSLPGAVLSLQQRGQIVQAMDRFDTGQTDRPFYRPELSQQTVGRVAVEQREAALRSQRWVSGRRAAIETALPAPDVRAAGEAAFRQVDPRQAIQQAVAVQDLRHVQAVAREYGESRNVRSGRRIATDRARAAGLTPEQVRWELDNAEANSRVQVTLDAHQSGTMLQRDWSWHAYFPDEAQAAAWTHDAVNETDWRTGTTLTVKAREAGHAKAFYAAEGNQVSVGRDVELWHTAARNGFTNSPQPAREQTAGTAVVRTDPVTAAQQAEQTSGRDPLDLVAENDALRQRLEVLEAEKFGPEPEDWNGERGVARRESEPHTVFERLPRAQYNALQRIRHAQAQLRTAVAEGRTTPGDYFTAREATKGAAEVLGEQRAAREEVHAEANSRTVVTISATTPEGASSQYLTYHPDEAAAALVVQQEVSAAPAGTTFTVRARQADDPVPFYVAEGNQSEVARDTSLWASEIRDGFGRTQQSSREQQASTAAAHNDLVIEHGKAAGERDRLRGQVDSVQARLNLSIEHNGKLTNQNARLTRQLTALTTERDQLRGERDAAVQKLVARTSAAERYGSPERQAEQAKTAAQAPADGRNVLSQYLGREVPDCGAYTFGDEFRDKLRQDPAAYAGWVQQHVPEGQQDRWLTDRDNVLDAHAEIEHNLFAAAQDLNSPLMRNKAQELFPNGPDVRAGEEMAKWWLGGGATEYRAERAAREEAAQSATSAQASAGRSALADHQPGHALADAVARCEHERDGIER
ncbi:hypothetical protein KO481_33490 [Nocardia sp. NEAU-G5]|uniref:TrwC relaxase domain-containing protein n=1 Tax=Nocardia albiluteola TaxID=2842303 RepID=A0ABS6B7Y9_9NOCA|nr:hypothetical protein [Nocardia albiluteola]MBU3066423.1 hypothetical protein [Nocardia albiluteola]